MSGNLTRHGPTLLAFGPATGAQVVIVAAGVCPFGKWIDAEKVIRKFN